MSTQTEKLTWCSEKEIEAKSPAKTRIKKMSGCLPEMKKTNAEKEIYGWVLLQI